MALDISTIGTLFLSYDTTRWRGRVPLCSDVTSPASGDWCFNTTALTVCAYDGTRWLGPEQVVNLKARSTAALVDLPIRTDYALYVTRVATTTNVATTNNAGNYYTITIQSVNTALSAADTVYSFTTAADSMGVETPHEGAPTGQPNSNRTFLRYIHGVTLGAPGTITSAATVYYRLIIP